MIEVMKEYLVSLGFSVDTSSLNSARAAMGSAEDAVAQFSNSSVSNFARAGVAVVAFVTIANIAIARFMGNLAQASLENEIFARRMWMDAAAARAYNDSLQALGVSLQELYLSPELMRKYLELNNLAKGMAVPDYDKQMRSVRDITFEFQKLKLSATMTLQWVGFYLTKYLEKPMADIKGGLSSVNELIQKNMPKWSEKAAMVVSWFARMGLAAWKIRHGLAAILTAFAAFKIINLLTSPLGMVILGLTALLLLIDDFTTYQSGGESAFPALWKWLDDLSDSMEDSGLTLENFKGKLDDIRESVTGLSSAFEDLMDLLGLDGGFGKFLESGLIATLMVLEDTLKSIVGLLTIIDGIAMADYGKVGDGWKKFMEGLPAGLFEAGKGLYEAFKGDPVQTSNRSSYMYPSNNNQSIVNVKMQPIYHINGATNPQGVATQVNRSNASLITRTVQGVNR